MQIITNGFKARDHRMYLDKLTVLIGPNGSGKSTIADAIRFAVLGHVPTLGKRPADTAALMRGEKMIAQMVFDDGRAIRREVTRNGDTLKTVGQTSWLQSKKGEEHNAAIIELFGNEELDVAECLDIRELLAASPNQRAARISEILLASMKDPKEKAERVSELVCRRLADKIDLEIDEWRELLPGIPKEQRAVLKEHGGLLTGKIIELGIAQTISWANTEKRAAMNEVKSKKKAGEELETRVKTLPDVDPAVVEEHREERDKLNKELGVAQERLERVRDYSKRAKFLASQLETAKKDLEKEKALRDEFEAHGIDISVLTSDLESAKEGFEKLELPKPADGSRLKELRDEIREIETEANELLAKQSDIPDTSPFEEMYRVAAEAHSRAKNSPWGEILRVIVPALAKAADKMIMKGWKEVRSTVAHLEQIAKKESGGLEKFQKEEEDRKANLEEETKRAEAIAIANAEISESHAEVIARLTLKEKEHCDLADELNKKDQERRAKYKEENDELRKKKDGLQNDYEWWNRTDASTTSALSRAKKDLENVEAQIRRHGKCPESGPDPVVIQARLTELKENLERMERSLATREELERIVKWIEGLEATSVVYSAFEWGLKRAREEELNEAGGPLVAQMSAFMGATKRKESPYFRAETAKVEIGWTTQEGLEVPIQALSGGEWCLFAAALTAAIINLRGAEIRVLLVEAGETDDKMIISLLDGINAVSEHLTAAVVMTPHSVAHEGWAIRKPEWEEEEEKEEEVAADAKTG